MPKQAMRIAGGESLFARTVRRVAGLVPPERIYVVTNADQADLLASQAGDVPRANIIGEPVARDSAPAALLAAAITLDRDADAVNVVMPADHLISPVERFHAAVRRAARLAERGRLVTFGIRPAYGATGFGYIERGERDAEVDGAWDALAFREKPDEKTAREYVASGDYYWNSGVFVWRADAVLDAARQYAGGHYDAIRPLGARFGQARFDEALAQAYEPLRKVSIDYAVMEQATNISVVEADFNWSDVGSHVALRDLAECDDAGNVSLGLARVIESRDCVVAGEDGHLLAVFGCEGMVVIQTGDATLVCPASRAQDLKRLVASLEADAKLKDYL